MRTGEAWKKIGFHPHHGICLILSGLRTKNSCGIGEFLDLLPLIDWCSNLKLDCIQLLPLNDTGGDPSPYNALSSCALDPVFLSLSALPNPGSLEKELEMFIPFNQEKRVSIIEVKREKLKWLRKYFRASFSALSKTKQYCEFVNDHPWLETYALFKSLKDDYGWRDWKDWPMEFQTPKQEHFEKKRGEIDFYSFLQFHCFDQLGKVKRHATEKKVFLKGDIPILLSPDSADVWSQPSFFKLELAAGAPPDYYNPLGQKWGFPLYDWDAMRHSGFSWWKKRLKVAEQFFHIYRLDHVVGLFRIWAIPGKNKPAEGFFVPADPSLWPGQGREILEMMIDSSTLLPIAEDLGTIPPFVRPMLKELGICATKVLRWQRDWQGDKSYLPFNEYEPLSMTTVSTPDMDALRGWWKKYPDESIPYAHFKHWTYESVLTPEKQSEILLDAHHSSSLFHINLLQEYLSLFPELSWPDPNDERINIPGTILPTNWTYRFKPTLEEIIAHQPLADAIRKILK